MGVVGVFVLPAGIILFLVWLAVSAESARRTEAVSVALPSIVLALSAILGLALSIIAWVRISGSAGGLRGLGFAITGTILPLALVVLAVPVSFLALVGGRTEMPPSPEWEADLVAVQAAPREAPEPVAIEALPGEAVAVTEELPVPSGIRVVGGTGMTEARRRTVARGIVDRMDRLRARLTGDPFDEERLRALYGGEKGTVMAELMGREKLTELQEANKAGLPLYDFGSLPVSIARYRIKEVRLDPRARHAVVTAQADSLHQLEFGMEKDGPWWFSMGSVTQK